ncbi:hypothetical protein B7494_g8644, partial [Chlorociboria aeruginascens]
LPTSPARIIELEHSSGESTATEDTVRYDTRSGPELQLTFNPSPAGQGWVFGTHESCDIVLPKLPLISRFHCSITFDIQGQVILRDFSSHGTILTYSGQGGEIRKTIFPEDGEPLYFTWILSGPMSQEKHENIVINIQSIKFHIILPKHDVKSLLYRKNVDHFLDRANASVIGAPGIQTTSTAAQKSVAQTTCSQRQPRIYIKEEEIGSGAFSRVYRVWDASTGYSYAGKYPIKEKNRHLETEVSIPKEVSKLSNKHIVQFVDFVDYQDIPVIILEFLPLGSLRPKDQRITNQESITILCQCLDALTSMHKIGIVHRDIKPANILVQCHDPLHIKLSDFGLAKATSDLVSRVGTPRYEAPEIHNLAHGRYDTYTKACDIWSLGVVIFEYIYGPLPYNAGGLGFCYRIIEKLNNMDSTPLRDLLVNSMLVIEPERRRSASYCWEQALQLSTPSIERKAASPISSKRPPKVLQAEQEQRREAELTPTGSFLERERQTNI